jgi:hypothetical protein
VLVHFYPPSLKSLGTCHTVSRFSFKNFTMLPSHQGQNHVTESRGASSPLRSNSAYADGTQGIQFLATGPQRFTFAQKFQDYDPVSKQYSRFEDGPEIKERKDSLSKNLDAAEKRKVPLCKRTKVDSSDSAHQSPWARKVILCLGRFS